MFYSTELLSHRRRGKLARCWLAATVSEKMFKKYCKPHFLEKIDVYSTCEEILLTVEVRNSSYGRFSLYLSAQLMNGITKILFYKTKLFQDYLFNTYLKLITDHRSEKEFNVRSTLNLPDVSSPNEVLRNLRTSSNLHLITEEPCTSVIEQMIRDEMNFGILPNHEMENFIFLGREEQSFEIRRFPWDVSEEAIKEPEAPLVNTDSFEIEEEIRLSSARRSNQRESIVTPEDDQLTKVSTSSRKRSMKPTEEISPKRRKTNPEEEAVSLPTLATDSVPVIEPQQDHVQQLPEDEEIIEVVKPKKKRKIFDKHTKISDAVMNKNIHDVTAHTIEHHRFTTILPPAKEYLKQPSTIIFNRSWGQSLNQLFKQHTVGPFVVENEFQTTDMEIEETIAAETLRANASKLRDQTGEISSKIGTIINETSDQSRVFDKTLLKVTIETTDQSKKLDKTLPAVEQPTELEENQQTEKKEESIVDLPEITYIEEKNREIVEKQQKCINGEKLKSKSESSSSRSEIPLSKQELLAFMEVQWHEKRLLTFHELFSPESYSKREVSLGFFMCLELQKEKAIILKQADCFGTIWIEKFPCYSQVTP